MAKTGHQSTRDLHTKGEQSKPRSLGDWSVARHVTDLQKMGLDEAQDRLALPQRYAGVPGQRAEQAWWQFSLCLEHWRSRQTLATVLQTSTNASTNLSDHVYTIARVAGIPETMLTPCVNIMEAMPIRNSLTVGHGAPHTRRRGIPQGCPFLDVSSL